MNSRRHYPLYSSVLTAENNIEIYSDSEEDADLDELDPEQLTAIGKDGRIRIAAKHLFAMRSDCLSASQKRAFS